MVQKIGGKWALSFSTEQCVTISTSGSSCSAGCSQTGCTRILPRLLETVVQGEEVLVFHCVLYGDVFPSWRCFPLRSVVSGLCVCHRWSTVVEVSECGGSEETAAVQTRLGRRIAVLPPVGSPSGQQNLPCECP